MKFLLDIVSTPAILVALIAVIGLILQKKSLPDIMKGGIKNIRRILSGFRWGRHYSKFIKPIWKNV